MQLSSSYPYSYPIDYAWIYAVDDVVHIVFTLKKPAKEAGWYSETQKKFVPIDIFESEYSDQFYLHDEDGAVIMNDKGYPSVDLQKIKNYRFTSSYSATEQASLIQ